MEIPEVLQQLPTYHGLPVPWETPIGPDGMPRFREISPERNRESVRFGLCRMCGRWVPGPFVFTVGPLCLAERAVLGGPMHDACARAALRLCPFLSQERWQRSEKPGAQRVFERDELPTKPREVGLATVPSYGRVFGPTGLWYSNFDQPSSVEWWTYVDGRLSPRPIAPDENAQAPYAAEGR